MRNDRLLTASLLLVLAAALHGCGDERPAGAAEPSGVAVTFYPLLDFAQRLLADDVEVTLPLPEGEDPIFWRPDEEALVAFRSARVVVSNGAEFEKWLASASLPESRHVRTADGFRDRFLKFQDGVKHSHGPAGEHVHEGVDGHTWVDPKLALLQVRAMETAFTEAFPEHAAAIRERAAALAADLEDLDARWTALAPSLGGVVLCASHPAYRYVARRYGVEIRDFDMDPKALLAPDQAHALEAVVAGATVPVVLLWESEPIGELLDVLRADLGVRSVVFSPAENPDDPPPGGYVEIQRGNLERLANAVRAAAGG